MIAQRTTLAALDWAGIAAACNRVYAGYAWPFRLDAAAAERLLRATGVRLDASPLWLDESGHVAGLAAVATAGTEAWIGGFGVAPEFRGRGNAQPLLEAALGAARLLGAQSISLEVFAGNAAAIRTYERGGLRRRNDVVMLNRAPGAPHGAPHDREVGPADPLCVLAGARDVPEAAWPQRAATLRRMDALEALVCGDPASPRAYVVFREGTETATVLACGGEDQALHRTLETVLAALPHQKIVSANVPAGGPQDVALRALGFAEYGRQHVMTRTL